MKPSSFSAGIFSVVLLSIFLIGIIISGCSTMSTLPEKSNLKVSRDEHPWAQA